MLTDRLDPFHTKYPIWNAGMGGGLAGPELVHGISEAGGFGVLGVGGLPSDHISDMISETRTMTRKPFGANIILPMSDGTDIDACFDNQVEVIILFWGDPQPFVRDARRRGVFLISQCGNAEESSAAASSGVDAVIIQGVEAGGHVKAKQNLSTTLEETCKELNNLPVIAAGGISSGRQIANHLKVGAKAVSLGTRFVASHEAYASKLYKERIISSTAADTTLTTLFDIGWKNARHRVIKTRVYEDWLSQGSPVPGDRQGENEIVGTLTINSKEMGIPKYTVFPPVLGFKGEIEELPLYAGESVNGITKIESASAIMAQLVKDLKDTTADIKDKGTKL